VTPVSEIGPFSFTPGQISQSLIADYATAVQPKAAQAAA
jgi:branched-chain amino acid aminotransferase